MTADIDLIRTALTVPIEEIVGRSRKCIDRSTAFGRAPEASYLLYRSLLVPLPRTLSPLELQVPQQLTNVSGFPLMLILASMSYRNQREFGVAVAEGGSGVPSLNRKRQARLLVDHCNRRQSPHEWSTLLSTRGVPAFELFHRLYLHLG